MKRFIYLVVAVALLVVAAVPVAATPASSNGHGFHAYVNGLETGFIPGPNEDRCPAGTEWILQTAGVGEAAGYGSFEYTSEHCSRVTAVIPSGAQGKLAAGIMVFTFDNGELTLGYQGSWKFVGDLSIGAGVADVQQSYEVLEGTGIFAGAKGHGQIGGVFDFGEVYFDITGSLVPAD